MDKVLCNTCEMEFTTDLFPKHMLEIHKLHSEYNNKTFGWYPGKASKCHKDDNIKRKECQYELDGCHKHGKCQFKLPYYHSDNIVVKSMSDYK